MMKNELEDRLGYRLENWQWELSEYVYMNSPEIKDVGGKDQIAAIIKTDGFNWNSKILEMYKQLTDKPIIKYIQEDLYRTWEVTHTGYCINEKPKKMSEVFKTIMKKFKTDYKELHDNMDYCLLDYDYEREHIADVFPINTRLAVFYVRGGSEGYYVHAESLSNGKHQNLFLAKTLLEGENGIQWAEKTVCAFSRIMQV